MMDVSASEMQALDPEPVILGRFVLFDIAARFESREQTKDVVLVQLEPLGKFGYAKLIDLAELDSRMVEYVTVEDTTTATVAAAYSGARVLTAASDLLVANTDFAILGAHIGATCQVLTVRGIDLGNLRVGIPGMAGRPDLTARWFPFLTEEFGLPLIPVFNTANKNNVFIENVQDQALGAVPFALVLARLSMS